MTISQTGEIRAREAGKGRNPPQWLGAYFAESPGSWFAACAGDVVFSSIDLWKGCIAIVPQEFNGALVSKEFPIYELLDSRLSAPFSPEPSPQPLLSTCVSRHHYGTQQSPSYTSA